MNALQCLRTLVPPKGRGGMYSGRLKYNLQKYFIHHTCLFIEMFHLAEKNWGRLRNFYSFVEMSRCLVEMSITPLIHTLMYICSLLFIKVPPCQRWFRPLLKFYYYYFYVITFIITFFLSFSTSYMFSKSARELAFITHIQIFSSLCVLS